MLKFELLFLLGREFVIQDADAHLRPGILAHVFAAVAPGRLRVPFQREIVVAGNPIGNHSVGIPPLHKDVAAAKRLQTASQLMDDQSKILPLFFAVVCFIPPEDSAQLRVAGGCAASAGAGAM